MHKVTKNYLLNLSYHIIILLVPLVTTPYVSRVIGAEGIGIYNYCLSISTYFIVAGTLGLPLYGKREIAYRRDNSNDVNRMFSELLVLQMILLGSSFILFTLVALLYQDYTWMLLICGVGIVAAIFDISWLFVGLEDFLSIAVRGLLIKLISVALIFLIVKDQGDLYLYALCIMLANLIGNICLFVSARKVVKFSPTSIKSVFHHVKPAVVLMLPSIVTTIYAVIDKTLLGLLNSNMSEVGYYEQSQKIVQLSLVAVTSMGTILMPRIASLFSKGDKNEISKYLNKGIQVISFLAIPIGVGMFCLSDNLVPWFYGDGFEKVKTLLKIFAPVVLLMGISDLLGTQVLIATKMEKKLFYINVASCVLNILLDIILIPFMMCYGAAIATLVSELFKTVVCFYFARKSVSVHFRDLQIEKYFFVSLIMGVVILVINRKWLIESKLLFTAIMALCGVLVYFSVLFLLRDSIVISFAGLLKKITKTKKDDFD